MPLPRILVLLAAVCFPVAAGAQQASQDKAAADAVFDQAKQLLAAGDVARACSMFEASLKLAEQLGTRLNLADCYDKLGRTASAWAEFREAASLAHKRGDRREPFARERAEALEPRLVKLVLTLPPGHRVAGLTVTRDGVALGAVYDTPIPIDPGQHVIAASADGYKPWSRSIDVGTQGTTKIEIPALAPAPKLLGPALRDPAAEARHTRKVRHVIGFVAGGAGIATIGASLFLGLQAKGKWDDAQAHCNGTVCDTTGAQLNQDARSLADTSTVVFGVGAAALATGVIVYLTAPKAPRDERPVVDVWPQRGGMGFSLSGRF